jgi:photosystem II stability/assembly factor-like uncharacterized protein
MRRQLFRCLGVLFLAILVARPLTAQTWRAMGPAGGDVRSLAADPGDPRLVYLGTSDGHVFGSRDGGEHWALLGRVGNRTDTVVMAVLADSRTSKTLYAATWTLNPGGGGVFRSTDGGHTWRLAGLGGEAVRAIAQAPSRPEVLIAGALAGVFRSNNSGESWTRISPPNDENLRSFDSVAIDPHNPDVIYAGTYHLAWKTNDGGRQWVPIHTGMIDDSDVMSISVDSTDPQRLYASACSGIYRAENGGEKWTKFHGIPPTARRTHVIRQDPQHPQTLYSATTEGLWKSVDGGLVWNRLTPANWAIISVLIHPKNSDRLVIGVEGQGIYVSDDGGRSFHPTNSGFYHRQVMDLAFDREHPGRMLVVLTNASDPILATQDGGQTWTPLGPGLKTHLLRHVYAAPDGWWAAFEGGGLMHYDEKRNSWLRTGDLAGSASPAVNRGAKSARAKSALAKTSARPLTAVVNDMAFGRDIWWAATENGLLASNNRGATWTVVSTGMPPRQPVHSVRLSADGNRIWLASPRGLAVSRDGGKNWTFEDLSFEARSRLRLDHADDGTLFVSHNYGVYASGDEGKSWKPLNLPVPIVQDFVVIGNALVLSTQKDGLHVSYNRGRTWEHIEAPLAGAYFPMLTAGAPAPVLLAGSSTEGVYSLEIPSASRASVADAQTPGPATSRSAQK